MRTASHIKEELLLVLTAPEAEATFLSLPYVEQLLALYCDSGLAPTGSGSAGSSTRHRVELERGLEEFYLTGPSPAAGVATGADRALGLLRRGLCRALGFPCTGGSLTSTSTAAEAGSEGEGEGACRRRGDVLLSRRRHTVALHSVDGRAGSVASFAEESGEELRRSAVLDWFLDVLGFIAAKEFSAVQARCVLANTMGVLECLDALPDSAPESPNGDAAVEADVAAFLAEAMAAQTCAVPTKVLETSVVMEPVTRTVPDPQLVAVLEQRLERDKKLSKKQRAAIEEQIQSAPLVTLTAAEERRVSVVREVVVGPCFSLSEAAAILGFIADSALQHWRLVKYCVAAAGQGAGHDWGRWAVLEDIDRSCLAPLASFLPTELHEDESERAEVWWAAREGAEQLFDELFAGPVEALLEEAQLDRERIQRAKEAADAENKACALNGDEYAHVQRAYELRLAAALAASDPEGRLGGGGGVSSQGPSRPASPPENAKGSAGTRPQSRQAASAAGGKGKRSNTPRPASPGSAVLPPLLAGEPRLPADAVKLPPNAPFNLPEVEQRVEVVDTSLNAILTDPKTAKKLAGKR